MRTFAVLLAMLLALAGCGGGSDPVPKAEKTATKTTPTKKVTVKPTVVVPTGKPAPEALSSFRCAADKKGRWNASGYLSNSGKTKVTYQVTVYVGEASGGSEDARTLEVANVAAGGSTKFSIRKVPAPKAGGPCYVQVLAES
jgi:predicted small lipoprotein YifL